jgi:hypothetical protein
MMKTLTMNLLLAMLWATARGWSVLQKQTSRTYSAVPAVIPAWGNGKQGYSVILGNFVQM